MNALVWTQISCSVGALFLAAWTLAILRGYAADTQKIADASITQLENSRTPFVTPVSQLDEGWGLENQGFGPAINGQLSFVQNGPHVFPLPCLTSGARLSVHNVDRKSVV